MDRTELASQQQNITSIKKPDSVSGSAFKKIIDQVFPNELVYNYDEPMYIIRWSLQAEKNFTAIGLGKPLKYTEGSDEYHLMAQEIRKKLKEKFESSDSGISDSIIIAETAATAELNIKSLVMDTVADTTGLNPKTPVTKFTMELFEPYGCTLYDQLHNSCLMLGISEWKKGFCNVLEIEFKGRNRTTGEFETCKFENTNKGKWRWRFCITGLEGKVDEGGTTYTVTGVPVADYAMDKQKIQLPMTFESTENTVGGLFKKLQLKINEWYTKQRAKNVSLPDDSFEFRFPIPELYKQKVKEQNFILTDIDPKNFKIDSKETNSTRKKPFGFKSGSTAKWGEGTTFDQILKDVQVATPDMQHLLHGKDPNSNQPGNPKEDRDKIVKFDFKIFPETVIKSYDPIIREYNRHYIYYIVPVVTFKPVVDEDKPNDRKDKEHQEKRYDAIQSLNAVNKKYSYIYTGENQDVMGFDISLNFMHFAQIPKSSASFTTQDAGLVNTPASQQLRNSDGKTPEEVTKLKKEQENELKNAASSSNMRDGVVANMVTTNNIKVDKTTVAKRLQSIAKGSDAASSTAAATIHLMNSSSFKKAETLQQMIQTKAQIMDILGKVKDSSKSEYNELRDYADQLSTEIIIEQEKNKAELAKQFSELGIVGGYSADLKYKEAKQKLTEKLNDKSIQSLIKNDIIKVITIADIEDLKSDATGAPVEEPYSQALTSAILKQAENSSQNLIDVTLDIRGDPYWMGWRDDMSVDYFVEDISQPNTIAQGIPNKNQSVTNTMMFILEFRFPEAINEETGQMEFNDQNIFKGIYSVMQITNKFTDGMFTQELKAYRELLTDIINEDLGVK